MDPTSFAEMRPGAYDVHERIRDMNRNGILSSMCFPTFAGFSAGTFRRADDKDLSLLMLQAYNDWHIDEWCAAYPGRFIPLAIGPTWDPEAMVAEIRRVSAKGCTAMTFPELPHIEGLPSYHDLDVLGSGVRGVVRRAGRDVPAHRPGLRGHQHRARRADRQHDHPRDAGVGVRGAGPAVGTGVPHLSRPQGRVVGSGHRLDPVLPRSLRPSLREPAVVGSRLRRQDAERHLPRPLARVLRERSGRAQGAPRHRHGHHRLGVRLPALRLDLARRTRDGDARDGGRGRHRRRDPQDHVGELRAALPVRSVRAHAEGRRRRSARCVRSHPTSTPPIRSRHEWAERYAASAVG